MDIINLEKAEKFKESYDYWKEKIEAFEETEFIDFGFDGDATLTEEEIENLGLKDEINALKNNIVLAITARIEAIEREIEELQETI